jgi:hypothetical protein
MLGAAPKFDSTRGSDRSVQRDRSQIKPWLPIADSARDDNVRVHSASMPDVHSASMPDADT